MSTTAQQLGQTLANRRTQLGRRLRAAPIGDAVARILEPLERSVPRNAALLEEAARAWSVICPSARLRSCTRVVRLQRDVLIIATDSHVAAGILRTKARGLLTKLRPCIPGINRLRFEVGDNVTR